MRLEQTKAILSALLQWIVSDRLLSFASDDGPLLVFFDEEAGIFVFGVLGVAADLSIELDKSRATPSSFSLRRRLPPPMLDLRYAIRLRKRVLLLI